MPFPPLLQRPDIADHDQLQQSVLKIKTGRPPRRSPGSIVPPFLEVGLAGLGQIFPPCRLERLSRGIKARAGAAAFIAGVAAGIKAANPLPLIR
jgi:hypothetical protein